MGSPENHQTYHSLTWLGKEQIKATDSNNSLCYKADQYRIRFSSLYSQATTVYCCCLTTRLKLANWHAKFVLNGHFLGGVGGPYNSERIKKMLTLYFGTCIYSWRSTFVPSLSKIGDLSFITSCLVFSWTLLMRTPPAHPTGTHRSRAPINQLIHTKYSFYTEWMADWESFVNDQMRERTGWHHMLNLLWPREMSRA